MAESKQAESTPGEFQPENGKNIFGGTYKAF